MTDNTTNKGGADAGSGSTLIDLDSADGQADLPEEPSEIDDLSEEFTGIDDDEAPDGVRGTGAVSGGFGFAGLALAVVSLTTNWTSSVVISHSQYSAEVKAPSSGMTAQQQLNMYASGWNTQGWWALAFAAAAVLLGAGALLWPRILRSGTPGWAKAAATGAIIVGVVGALLAVLTVAGVFGGHLVAPATAG
jgi:protein-S-isoprenylcysteine O-methyltransferase Ste14